MDCSWKNYGRFLSVASVLVIIGAALPTAARAQPTSTPTPTPCQHGVGTAKTCESPRRSCTTNADCQDPNECTDDVCDTTMSNVTNCLITLSHADTCGDRTKIHEAFDVEDVGGDNVRVPPAGNLPIDSINGNAVCCAGPVLPCFVAPAGDAGVIPAGQTGCGALALPGVGVAGSVQFRQNTYVVQPGDPDPLPDQSTVRVEDLCNFSSPCTPGIISTVQFTAATDLVSGCLNPPKQESTPCTDNDGNGCTTAGCDETGNCDQAHILKQCPTDECNTGQCDPALGCIPREDSTPCPDTDENTCTTAGCEATGEVGTCDQNHVLPDSTPCADTDENVCTQAGCDGAGSCDQRHVLPDSTPCPDTGNDCATAGCDGAGNCDQNHIPEQDSTPCPDTDGDVCTLAGCNDLGTCVQRHLLAEGCLGHFQCYETPREPFTVISGLSLDDQFGPGTVDVIRLKRFCNPADKNDEDPTAPGDPEHLAGYVIKQRTPKFARREVSVVNQFGTIVVEVVKPEILLVPSAKSLTAPPPPLSDSAVDHFKCYRVRRAKTRVAGVKVRDQLGTLIVDVKRPFRLCVPADKDGGGIGDPAAHLMCYKVLQKSLPRFRGIEPIFINNQFGASTIAVDHVRELCVPSEKNPVP